MLRSIFSLIQNIIIDSDKEYHNQKSNTVIYLMSNSDSTYKMDFEIDGKPRENVRLINKDECGSSFKVTTEQGDTVTCKHSTEEKISEGGTKREDDKLSDEYKEQVEKLNERTTFSNEETVRNKEQVGKDKEGKDNEWAETKVQDLFSKVAQKQAITAQKDKDQIVALMEQIQKMKMGMERLQEIAQQFNTSDNFKQDVEFLRKNVGPALEKSESADKNLSPKL